MARHPKSANRGGDGRDGHSGLYRLSEDERAAVREGMEAARRGEFASDEEIERLYRRALTRSR